MFLNSRPSISCMISMTDGQSGDHGRVNLDYVMDKARKFWNELPQPVKSFPWSNVLDNFIKFILNIVAAVIKYLSAPVLAVSSLSEMSYCAQERKLFLVPVPFLLGFAVAGIFKVTASELSPLVKDAEIPWHLIATAICFTLLKLPGPYYPYWGRVVIPHFANGGLVRVFWMMYLWYRRPKEDVSAHLQQDAESLEQN